MSTLRFDPTTSDWVIFSPSRSLRPHDLPVKAGAGDDLTADAAKCPFCPANEAFTPPEIYSLRSPSDPAHWQVRASRECAVCPAA